MPSKTFLGNERRASDRVRTHSANSLEFLEGLEHVHLEFLVLVGNVAKLRDECNVVNLFVVVADLSCWGDRKEAFHLGVGSEDTKIGRERGGRLTLQCEGRQGNHHLVGALEPLGQDVLLQLQEELVPEREGRNSLERFSWKRRMGWSQSVSQSVSRVCEGDEDPETHFGWRQEEVKTSEGTGKGGREGNRGIFK